MCARVCGKRSLTHPFLLQDLEKVCGGEEEEGCREGDAGDAGVRIGGGAGGDGDWYVFNSNCKEYS